MRCCGCGAEFEDHGGPTHSYMLSSPGCWAAFGRVLAREYSDRHFAASQRLTVDAYAAQHPGVDGPQARNSVGIHLSRLCLILERGWAIEQANAAMVAITAKKRAYPWLVPPLTAASRTIADAEDAGSEEGHRSRVRSWAECVWQSWSAHHGTVHAWVDSLELSSTSTAIHYPAGYR